MHLFVLILTTTLANGTIQTDVMDYNLTSEDCFEALVAQDDSRLDQNYSCALQHDLPIDAD